MLFRVGRSRPVPLMRGHSHARSNGRFQCLSTPLSKRKGYVGMKFDCAKVSGKVDYVRSVTPINGGYKATVVIDGAALPNLQLSNKLYEELNVGENVTLYGIFRKSGKKEKNDGVLYGLQTQAGEKMFATHYRYQVPLLLAFFAVISFCVVFVVGWFVSVYPVIYLFDNSGGAFMYNNTAVALVEASIAAGFFLWRAWIMFSATSDPEAWESIAPATLSSRFSKFHK